MDLRSIRTFIAVAESRGFASAAEILHYSQPTISGHIAALESELGVTLFNRDRRPVELTPPGAALLPHARAILHQMEAARDEVTDFLGAKRGTVRLGTYPSATAGYVPTLLAQFREAYPLVEVRLSELGGAYLEQAAAGGEVDLFIRQTTPPLSSLQFENVLLWQEDFKVILHPEHPLCLVEGAVRPSDLVRQALIMTGSYHPEEVLTHPFWNRLGEPPQIAYEVSQPQSLIAMVRMNHGVGVTTALAVQVSQTDGVVIKAIDDASAVRDVALYWPRKRPLASAAIALREFMLQNDLIPACAQRVG